MPLPPHRDTVEVPNEVFGLHLGWRELGGGGSYS